MKKLLCFALLALCTVSQTLPCVAAGDPAATASSSDLGKQLDALVAARFPTGKPGVAVLVIKQGQVVLRAGYGSGDLAQARPISPDQVFRIGSLTKQFTAAAIMLLVEQGKLSLNDRVTRFLPQLPEHGITIEHLLTHTSGIVNFTSKRGFGAMVNTDMTVDAMIDTFSHDPLDFPPGTNFNYSNSGYFLLGAVIEKVSGQSYAHFIHEHIFMPLQMKHAVYGDAVLAGMVRTLGYTDEDGHAVPAAPISLTIPFAAGALSASVDDLLLWEMAMREGRLLKPSSWQRLLTPYTRTDGSVNPYAYGWFVEKLRGKPVQSHTGGINGFASMSLRMPEQGVYVAVLSNEDELMPAVYALTFRLAAIAAGEPFPQYKEMTLDAAREASLVGTYVAADGDRLVIGRSGQTLKLSQEHAAPVTLHVHAVDAFHVDDSLNIYQLERGKDGSVSAIEMQEQVGRARRIRFERTTTAATP